jgi:hypothetical protein
MCILLRVQPKAAEHGSVAPFLCSLLCPRPGIWWLPFPRDAGQLLIAPRASPGFGTGIR